LKAQGIRTDPPVSVPQSCRHDPRADCGCGTRRRAARDFACVIGVADAGRGAGLECRVVAGYAERQFVHVGLADDDGARRPQFCCDRGILARYEPLENRCSRGRRQASDFDVVLDDDRDAAERLARGFFGAAGVERNGRLHGARFVECDEGVETWLALARASAADVNAWLVILPAHRSAAACFAVNPSRSIAAGSAP